MDASSSPPAPPLRILVTGAAGLIGSELCGALAARGHAVVALVHRNPALRRNDGRVLPTGAWPQDEPEAGRVVTVGGDVRRPDLGLSPADAARLAASIDRVVHGAAATGFASAPSLLRAVNVDGTANVLAFLRDRAGARPGLVHVSTAYVSGNRSGPVSEAEGAPDAGFANGYEATKAEAEALVRRSASRWAIARPSIVVGTARDGRIGRFENIYGLLKLIGSGRIAALPSTPGATLDLVPIDHVVGGLVDLVERFESAADRTFHLVARDPTPLAALVGLDYPGFHVPRLVDPARFDANALDPLAAMIHGSVTALYAAYLQRDPRFAADNLRALSGRVCPATGPGFLRLLIDYATQAGFLRPDPALAARAEALT